MTYDLHWSGRKLTVSRNGKKFSNRLLDWILHALEIENETIAVLFAHNFVSLFNVGDDTRLIFSKSQFCLERCVLMSGEVVSVDNRNHCLVGTIFGDILLWELQNGVTKRRFVGHKKRDAVFQGPVTAVHLSRDEKLVYSTSDDRSVCVWSSTEKQTSPLAFGFAHTARPHCVVEGCSNEQTTTLFSGASDGSICVWRFCVGKGSLTLMQQLFIDRGPIDHLTVDTSRNTFMAQLYHGGKIRVHLPPSFTRLDNQQDQFKIYRLLSGDTAQIDEKMYNFCCLGTATLFASPKGIHMKKDDVFSMFLAGSFPFDRLCSSRDGLYAAVANTSNSVVFFNIELTKQQAGKEQKPPCHNVRFANTDIVISIDSVKCVDAAENHSLLIVGLLSGMLHLYRVESLEGTLVTTVLLAKVQLPSSKRRRLSVCLLRRKSLIIGDQNGRLEVYKIPDTQCHLVDVLSPLQQMIHGKSEVTDIRWDPSSSAPLWSLGRDGRLIKWMHDDHNNFEITSAEQLGCGCRMLEWPARFYDDPFQIDRLLILGFRGPMFCVFDYTLGVYLCELECGGGHRAWTFLLRSQMEGVYCFLKNGVYIESVLPLWNCEIVEETLHKSPLWRILPLSGGSDQESSIVTSGLDVRLTVSRLSRKQHSTGEINVSTKVIQRFSDHLSGNVCFAQYGTHVLSAGAKGEIFLWRRNLENDTLRQTAYWRQEKGVRFMDIATSSIFAENNNSSFLAAACRSDGKINLFQILVPPESSSCEIRLLSTLQNVSGLIGALVAVRFVNSNFKKTTKYVSAVSTDGNLWLWKVDGSQLLIDRLETAKQQSAESSSLFRDKCWRENRLKRVSVYPETMANGSLAVEPEHLHVESCGLSALDVAEIGEGTMLVIGSESGCIHLLRHSNTDSGTSLITSQRWHVSTITALEFICAKSSPYHLSLISLSTDQRLVVSKVILTNETDQATELSFCSMRCVSVGDPSDFALLSPTPMAEGYEQNKICDTSTDADTNIDSDSSNVGGRVHVAVVGGSMETIAIHC